MITLKAARINKSYTQEKAAKLIGVSTDTLRKYERGETYPTVPIISRIEVVYGLGYNDIIFSRKNTVKP